MQSAVVALVPPVPGRREGKGLSRMVCDFKQSNRGFHTQIPIILDCDRCNITLGYGHYYQNKSRRGPNFNSRPKLEIARIRSYSASFGMRFKTRQIENPEGMTYRPNTETENKVGENNFARPTRISTINPLKSC